MSFDKEFKKSTGTIKSGSQGMIGSDYSFYCAIADIFRKDRINNDETGEQEDTMVFPTTDEMFNWMKNLFTKDLAYKALPAKALENMKKKGINPKKQPGQILNIIVTASETTNLILIHFPGNKVLELSDSFDLMKIIKSALNDSDYDIEESGEDYIITLKYDPKTEKSPFKERDTILRNFFTQLKTTEIYSDEPDSDKEEDKEEDKDEN